LILSKTSPSAIDVFCGGIPTSGIYASNFDSIDVDDFVDFSTDCNKMGSMEKYSKFLKFGGSK